MPPAIAGPAAHWRAASRESATLVRVIDGLIDLQYAVIADVQVAIAIPQAGWIAQQ